MILQKTVDHNRLPFNSMHIASVAFAHSFVQATIHFVVTQNLYPIYDTLNHRNSNVCAILTNLIITTSFILQAILVGKNAKLGVSGQGVNMNTIGDLKSPDGYT